MIVKFFPIVGAAGTTLVKASVIHESLPTIPSDNPKTIQTVHFLVELGLAVELVDEELVTVELSSLEVSSLEVSVLEASVLEASVLVASVVDVSVLDVSVLEASVLETLVLDASVLDASSVELVLVELFPDELAEVEAASSDNSSGVASGRGVLEEGNALLAPDGLLERIPPLRKAPQSSRLMYFQQSSRLMYSQQMSLRMKTGRRRRRSQPGEVSFHRATFQEGTRPARKP
uniref:Uncharacterized protein n=1 Tax=Bionectria ochroleuca TaxID=29856 RepID=A0A8H7N7C0_BIOOC